jgi:NarL family two-component system response regulator LiaR
VIRVLIVDDHRVVRQGLRFVLDQENDIEVVGECSDGDEALRAVRGLTPTVVLLDLFMPGPSGLEVLAQIKREAPATEVVVLTSSHDHDHLLAAIRAGAVSFLSKTAGVEEVLDAVRAAARGESVLAPSYVARLVREVREGPTGPLAPLTTREIEVLEQVARGRTNREIARALHISEETVKGHVSSVLAKLGLSDRTQAAIVGLQAGLVPLAQALTEPPRSTSG